MGSFNSTCAVSGLPLKAGTPVRILLLTQSQYEDNQAHRACHMTDWWVPRTLPIKAHYNDYGGIEDVQEGLCRDIWVDLLKRDLVEKGTGDNSYHDVPVSTDMDIDGLFEAIWEGRLEVHVTGRQPRVKSDLPDTQPTYPEWIPTIRSVTARLPDPSAFLVDELEPGAIRVRCEGYGVQNRLAVLQEVKDLLSPFYPGVVTAGSGAYSQGQPELRLFSPPIKEAYVGKHGSTLEGTQLISFAMIREDVWQALLNLPIVDWGKNTGKSVATFKEELVEHYQLMVEHNRNIAELRKAGDEVRAALADLRLDTDLHMHGAPFLVARSYMAGAMVAIHAHWAEVAKRQLPLEEVEDFIDSAAEMSHVECVLSGVRFLWKPTTTVGPQHGEYSEHERFYRTLAELSGELQAKYEEELA